MKSARIKRRNADVFMGAGSPPSWVKTTPYGTYHDGAVRMADKAREIGKNANRTCHKKLKCFELRQMYSKFR